MIEQKWQPSLEEPMDDERIEKLRVRAEVAESTGSDPDVRSLAREVLQLIQHCEDLDNLILEMNEEHD